RERVATYRAAYAEALEGRGDIAAANHQLKAALAALGTRPAAGDSTRSATASFSSEPCSQAISLQAAVDRVDIRGASAVELAAHRVMALEAGADGFVAEPVEGAELSARVRSALRLKELYSPRDGAEHVIFSLAAAVEAKDAFTERHTQRVGESARLLGQCLGL